MKRAAAYYLLLFYSVALFKPVLPLFADIFAHQFSRAAHLSQVHQHKGTYHLHKELKESSSTNDDNNNHSTLKTSEPFSTHILSEIPQTVQPQISSPTLYLFLLVPLFSSELQNNFPPPRA